MRKLLLALLVAPGLAAASGYEVINVNPRDLALVGSGTAAQREATATYFNPAALSRLSGLNLTLSGSILELKTTWSAPSGLDPTNAIAQAPDTSTKWQPVPPVSLFAAYATQLAGHGLGVGFGMSNPGGGNMHWPDDWIGAGRIITVERRVYQFLLNAGYEVIPQLRLGGGVIYDYGTQYLKQAVEPFTGAYGELAAKGGGWGYQASAEITPVTSFPLTIGVDYKHKVKMEMSGDGHFSVPGSVQGAATQDQSVKTDLTFPNVLNVGVAYKPLRQLTLSAVYTFSRFVVYQEDKFVGSAGLTLVVPRDYSNGNVIRLGGEWDAERWAARVGVLRDWSGLNTDHYSPTLPDSNTWGFGVGGGWKLNPALSLNAAFFLGLRDEVTSTNWKTPTNPNGSFPGTYDTNVWIASLGVTWRTDLGQ